MVSLAAAERRLEVVLAVVPAVAPVVVLVVALVVEVMEVQRDPIAKTKATRALPGLPEENVTTTA